MSDFAVGAATGTAASGIDRDWLAVFASMFGQIMSIGTLTLYTFGVFLHPLGAEFGWSRTQLAGTVSISQLSIGLASPFWGLLADRFGPRAVLLPSTVLLAVLVASLALLTPHLWHLYLTFFLLSVLGAACSPLGYSAVLVRRFDRHLGLSLGLAIMGVGLGAALLPSVSQHLIASLGWRGAYVALAIITLLAGLPAVLIATRHVHGPVLRHAGAVIAQVLPPILPLVRSRTFMLMVAVFLLLGTTTIGTLAHFVPMMVDRGFTPTGAAGLSGLTGAAVLTGRGAVGWVLDRLPAPRVIAAVIALAVVAFLLLALGTGTSSGYLAAILLGGVMGAEVDFIAYLIQRHFAPEAFGRLYGIAFLAYMLGGAIGPLVLGMSFDRLGGYRPGLLLFAVIGANAAAFALAIPRNRTARDLAAG